jgi:hypothetical protein
VVISRRRSPRLALYGILGNSYCTLIAPRLLTSALANLLVSWPNTVEMRPGPLFPNADTINFDDEQLPAVMVHRRMHLQIRCQSCDEFRKSLSVVVHLQRDDSFGSPWVDS